MGFRSSSYAQLQRTPVPQSTRSVAAYLMHSLANEGNKRLNHRKID